MESVQAYLGAFFLYIVISIFFQHYFDQRNVNPNQSMPTMPVSDFLPPLGGRKDADDGRQVADTNVKKRMTDRRVMRKHTHITRIENCRYKKAYVPLG